MIALDKATPRPWRVTKRNPTIISNNGGDKWLARALIGPTKSPRFLHDSQQAEANAALIVQAVNAHDDLVALAGSYGPEVSMLNEEIEALTAERDALKAENAELRQANEDLLKAVRPFAMRGENINPVQHVALTACRKAREVYDRLHKSDCLILWLAP